MTENDLCLNSLHREKSLSNITEVLKRETILLPLTRM